MDKLTFGEKIFCEFLSFITAGWWLFLLYVLYVSRNYFVVGISVLIVTAFGISVFEMITGAKDIREGEEHT